jgi:hypothetical protein
MKKTLKVFLAILVIVFAGTIPEALTLHICNEDKISNV